VTLPHTYAHTIDSVYCRYESIICICICIVIPDIDSRLPRLNTTCLVHRDTAGPSSASVWPRADGYMLTDDWAGNLADKKTVRKMSLFRTVLN